MIAVGLILKRSPVILRSSQPIEAGMQSFNSVMNKIEGSPYNKDFFESQVAKKKSADPVPFESRQGPADMHSTQRHLDRSLYLTILPASGKEWKFPSAPIEADESLHDAAKRRLSSLCGSSADIWVTGQLPVAVTSNNDNEVEKVFFMKSQLLSGKLDQLQPDKAIKDYAWLTKEEISSKMDKKLFEDIKDSLADL